MTHKPFSQACENNKDPILQVIRTVFSQPTTVWEIGSGTGQHAGIQGQYNPASNTYDPPAKYRNWETVVRQNDLRITVQHNLTILPVDGAF
jgi:hypothetical protein